MASLQTLHLDPPVFDPKEDVDAWLAKDAAYIEALRKQAKSGPGGADQDVGEVLRFPRGDGYALYMVWSIKPLRLAWIAVGDAWRVEPALIRGLNVADVRSMAHRERSTRALFGGHRVIKLVG